MSSTTSDALNYGKRYPRVVNGNWFMRLHNLLAHSQQIFLSFTNAQICLQRKGPALLIAAPTNRCLWKPSCPPSGVVAVAR
jgi:hypothetical protein